MNVWKPWSAGFGSTGVDPESASGLNAKDWNERKTFLQQNWCSTACCLCLRHIFHTQRTRGCSCGPKGLHAVWFMFVDRTNRLAQYLIFELVCMLFSQSVHKVQCICTWQDHNSARNQSWCSCRSAAVHQNWPTVSVLLIRLVPSSVTRHADA